MAQNLDSLVTFIKQHLETSQSEGKMSLAKKKETLYAIYLEVQKVKDKKTIIVKQKMIEPLLFSLCEMGWGVSLVNEIMTLVSYFYRHGDASTIPAMLEKLRGVFENTKSLYSKICCWRLTGKIFEEFWKKTITPPTLDTVQSLAKMFKNSSEWYTKETAIETLIAILKTNCPNLDTAISDIYKLIIKGISDKSKDLRLSSTRALLHFVKAVNLLQEIKPAEFQNIITTAIKGFSDIDEKTRCTSTELLKEIFWLKIKQNIEGVTIDPKMASGKKKLYESLPDDLLGVVKYLSTNIYNKTSSSNYERKWCVECIFFIIHEVPLIFSTANKNELIAEVLSLKPKDKSGKNPPERSDVIVSNRLVSWLISQIIKEVERDDQKQMLEIITKYLIDSNVPDDELSVLLNAFNTICQNIDCKTAFKSDNDLTNILMPFIRSGKLCLQVSTWEVIKTVSHHTPEWIHPLISTLVSHTSITHAELAGLPFTPVYVLKLIPKVTETYHKDSIKKAMSCLNQVNALAHALALVFSSVNHSLKGVPITLSNSSFNAAKAMIMGNFQTEDDEEDIVSVGLNDFDISDSPRREAGWILFEGLLHLGNQWVGSKVTTIYKLWNSVFSKDMCEVDVERIKNRDALYLEKILTEFKIKKQALSSIKCFLNKWYVLLNSQLIKLIAGFLINAITFFISQDKKEIIKLFKTSFNEDYIKVRSDLYECLSNLHPSLYSGKFVHILHSATDDIVNETLSKTAPNIASKTLCKEDELTTNPYIHKEWVPNHLMNDDMYYDSSSSISGELLDLTVRHSPWIIADNDRMSSDPSETDIRMTVRNNAIQTFADIFISSQLNIKNKVQLSNHLLLHVKNLEETMIPSKKNKKNKNKEGMSKERKISKLVTISSAAYMIALGLVKKSSKDIDQQVFGNIESILRICLSIESTLLNRVWAEGLVLLYRQVTTPEYMSSIVQTSMKVLQEEQQGEGKSAHNIQRHVLVFGNMLRYMDEEDSPQLMETLLSVFTELSKTTNSVLRQYVMHYLSMSNQEEFYKNTYPICFHQMQTDILPELFISNSMCRFTERILRHYQIITDIQSKCILVFKEFMNHGLSQAFNMNTTNYLVRSYLRLTKTVMILQDKVKKDGNYKEGQLPLVEDEIYKIAKIIIKLIDTTSDIHIKQICIEIVAVILNMGDIEMLEQIKKGANMDEDFYCFLFNELNSTKTMVSPFNSSKMRKKISNMPSHEHIIHHSEFERIINFNHNAVESFIGNNTEYEQYCREYYEYSLEIVFLYAFKISGHYKLDMWIKFCRFFISYKHMSLTAYIEKEKTRQEEEKEQDEEEKVKDTDSMRNPGPLDFRLSTDLKEDTKVFMIQCCIAFVANYATTDGHSKTDISKHISKLINIAFSAANSEDDDIKKTGLTLIIELVKKFQYTEEAVDKEDAETLAQMQEENSLLIEQYEAQISSIIRQNIKKEILPDIQIKAFDLLYYFITVPISRDPEIISRILSQITSDMDSLCFQGGDQGFYDRIVSEAHFEKLQLLWKLFLITKGEEIEKFYAIDINPKSMNEEKDLQNIINSKRKLKLKKEDKKQIQNIFKELNIEKILTRHLHAALYDTYIVLAMPRAVVRNHKRFVFLASGMRSAYNLTTMERTIQYFMKSLAYQVNSKQTLKEIMWNNGKEDSSIKDIFEVNGECKDHEILLALIQFFLVKSVEQDEGGENANKESSTSHALHNHLKLKDFCIKCLISISSNISIEFDTLKEIMGVLDKLSFIAVVDINSSILKFCNLLLQRISKSLESDEGSIISTDTGDEGKIKEKENHLITLSQNLALKILSQMQNYVYQELNLGELKKKLTDKMFDGLESKYLDDQGRPNEIKTSLLKEAFELNIRCMTTRLEMKNYCTGKDHLNKLSHELEEGISSSFETTIQRFACKLPLCVSSFAKYYYTTLLPVLDSLWEPDCEYLSEKFNSLLIRLLYTIKICNSLSKDGDLPKESSEDDSESNSEHMSMASDGIVDPKKVDDLKTSILYMIQILNKAAVNSCDGMALESVKEGLAFYMQSVFQVKENTHQASEIVDFKQMALKGLNGLFAQSLRNKDDGDAKIAQLSKYCFEDSLVFLFSNVKRVFDNPSWIEENEQRGSHMIGEAIKFISNTYLVSTSQQKEVMIDPVIKLLLGILVGLHEKQIQRSKPILTIINATGDALYNMIVNGDPNLAKNYIGTSLNDQQKTMLQNIIKAIAGTKRAQEEKEQKMRNQKNKGQKPAQSNKFKENQSKIKLATKIGK